MKSVLCLAIVVLLALACSASSEHEKVVICYVGTWAAYRPGLGRFEVEDINTRLCTHLVYTFAGLGADSNVISLDPWLDLDASEGGGRDNYRKFNALKRTNPKLKTLLAVGGFNEGSAKYSIMAASPTRRAIFIRTALATVEKYDFDGLHISWQRWAKCNPYYKDSVFGPADKRNFNVLLSELKEVFERRGLLVTVAVAAVERSAAQSYDVRGLSSNVDFIDLMTYDFHVSADATTGHNAGLFRSASELNEPEILEFTVDASVDYWLSEGCPPEKLVISMPFYGHTFTLANPQINGVGAPVTGPGIAGPYTVTWGTIAYYEFCDLLRTQTWNIRHDQLARVPYAFQNFNWVSYDDPWSVSEKTNYALRKGLGGISAWSLESDDFNGICGEAYPLLGSINRALDRV